MSKGNITGIGKFHEKAADFLELAREELLKEYQRRGRTEPPTDDELTEKAGSLLESHYAPSQDVDEADWYGNWLVRMGAKQLSVEDKLRRTELHRSAVKAMMQGGLLGEYQVSKYQLPEDRERSMNSFLYPGHESEYEQLAKDWKAAKAANDPMALAQLQLKVTKWLLENDNDPAFREGQTDEELMKSWPKINQLGRSAGEIINFFDASDDPLLLSTGLLSEKEFRQYRERVDRMYVQHSAAINRLNVLANPLYPYEDIEAPTRTDEKTFQAFSQDVRKKYGGTANPYTLAQNANYFDRSMELDRLSDRMIQLGCRNKFALHYYDTDHNEVMLTDVMTRLRKGEMLFAVDAENPKEHLWPVAMEPGKSPIVGEDALTAADKGNFYKKPNITGAGLYRRLPGFLQKAFFSKEKREKLDQWVNGRRTATHGRLDWRKMNESREALREELTEKYAKSIKSRTDKEQKHAETRQAWRKARRQYLEKQNEQLFLDMEKSPRNYLDAMKRDCIQTLGQKVQLMQYGRDEDLSDTEMAEIRKAVGKAMFISHLEDVRENGSPEVIQALDQLKAEGIEKLFEDYQQTKEYKEGIRSFVNSPLISELSLNDIAVLHQSGKLLPVELDKSHFDALERYQKSMKDWIGQMAKDTRRYGTDLRFDLKAALQKAIDRHKAADAPAVGKDTLQNQKGEMDQPVLGGMH